MKIRQARFRGPFFAVAGGLGVAAVLLQLGNCAGPGDAGVTGVGITNHIATREPAKLLGILTDASAPEEARQKADQIYLLQPGCGATDDRRLAALELIVFVRVSPDAMRIYALDQIVAADPRRAVRSLNNYLAKIPVGPALDHACKVAAQLHDPRLIAALIQSLDRPGTGNAIVGRPEVAAIERITGQGFQQGLEATFRAGPDAGTQLAAVTLLRHLRGDEAAMRWILEAAAAAPGHAPVANAAAGDMAWCVATFNALPATMGDLAALQGLREPGNAGVVAAAQRRHGQLKKVPGYQFALRFVGVLAHLDDATAALSRQQLIDDLQTRLAHVEHIKREPKYRRAPDDVEETFEANVNKLTWCDLVVMRLVVNGLEEERLPAALMALGAEDRADGTTEFGGLLQFKEAQIIPVPYPPQYHNSDFQYAATDALARDAITGLAQYHFHFQRPDNEAIAGPGSGDLLYVKTARCSALVFTAVRGGRLDADYYTPEGAVVDLGVWPK